jgi:hypothetical protein
MELEMINPPSNEQMLSPDAGLIGIPIHLSIPGSVSRRGPIDLQCSQVGCFSCKVIIHIGEKTTGVHCCTIWCEPEIDIFRFI